ncbi:MAG: hypothetical protein AAF664_13635 [Planctomycetota bacterium]
MTFIKRYWTVALLLCIVGVHAAVIGYIRSQVADLAKWESTSFKVGDFRFQNGSSHDTVYQFELHAILDPQRLHESRKEIMSVQPEIQESCDQMLRQVDPQWLNDPMQVQLRRRLIDIIQQHLQQPSIEKVIILQWLRLPATNFRVEAFAGA